MRSFLVVLSAVLSTLAYVPYARAIIKGGGTVRPNRASWFTWWVVDAAMVWSLAAAGEWSAVPMFAAFTLGSSVILALSVKGGEGGFTPLDLSCIAVALLGLVIWKGFASSPMIAVSANALAAVMGAVPTIIKAYHNPESEDALTWRIFLAGGTASVLAASSLTYAALIGPVVVVGCQLGINYAIIFGSKEK
jgi:hypothetical protein